MKRLASFLLATAIACGGGGGGGGNSGGGGPDPQLVAVAKAVLEGCGADLLQNFVTLVTSVEALLDPLETNLPNFTVDAVNNADGLISFSLDNDGIAGPDFIITLQFADAQNQPVAAPFDLTPLLTNGLDDLDVLVQQVPDGSRVILTINGVAIDPQIFVSVNVEFQGAAPSNASVDSLRTGPDCDGSLTIESTPFGDFAGAVPTVMVTLIVTTLDGSIGGDANLDGTEVADVDIDIVDGTQTSITFTLNLTTGAVTEVP